MFDLVRTRRQGVPIPVSQLHSQPALRGILKVNDQQVPGLQRLARVVSFELAHPGQEPVTPLVNAELVEVLQAETELAMMVLSGTELVKSEVGEDVEYAQSWWLRTAATGESTPLDWRML